VPLQDSFWLPHDPPGCHPLSQCNPGSCIFLSRLAEKGERFIGELMLACQSKPKYVPRLWVTGIDRRRGASRLFGFLGIADC
jgi:hypothetical protein